MTTHARVVIFFAMLHVTPMPMSMPMPERELARGAAVVRSG